MLRYLPCGLFQKRSSQWRGNIGHLDSTFKTKKVLVLNPTPSFLLAWTQRAHMGDEQ